MSAAAKCSKIGYATEEVARRAAREVPNSAWPYRCHACGAWHISSRPPFEGPVQDEELLKLPPTGNLPAVAVRARRFRDGRVLSLTLKVEGHPAFVVVTRKHLHALKMAIDIALRDGVVVTQPGASGPPPDSRSPASPLSDGLEESLLVVDALQDRLRALADLAASRASVDAGYEEEGG